MVGSKPYDSKIILTKKADAIDIIVPWRLDPNFLVLNIVGTIIPILVITPLVMRTGYVAYILACLLVFYLLVTYFFTNVHILITNEYISYYIAKFRFFPSSKVITSHRSNVTRLTSNLNDGATGKKIVIVAGEKIYPIHTSNRPECEWLLAELGEWLNLPVSQ
jgi:hypothetical protein